MKRLLGLMAVVVFVTGAMLYAGGAAEPTDEVRFSFGHLGSEETAYHQGAVRFAERLEELSNGRFTIEIYPDGQLGDEDELFEQQIAGALDFSVVNPGKIIEFSRTANIFMFPFMWRDVDHWDAVLGGELGEEISQMIYNESGVLPIGYFGGGVRNVVSRVPLGGIEDLEGLTLRTNMADPEIPAWRALGADPVPYAYDEIYTGLQTGTIDALLNESEWVEIMGFHEVAPYIGLSEHEITVRFFTMSGQTWDQLSDEDRALVEQAAGEAAEYARDLQVSIDFEALDRIQEQGAELVAFDKERMQDIVREPVLEVGSELGLDDLYERIQQAGQ